MLMRSRMKKIFLIFNGSRPVGHIVSSAVEIARVDNALLHAIFLMPVAYKPVPEFPFVTDQLLSGATSGRYVEQDNEVALENNIRMFKDACSAVNVAYKLSTGKNISLGELIQHSVYSDLIIADTKTDFPETTLLPHIFSFNDLLAGVHCPVLLFQDEMKKPDQIILCYDGSVASMYALKMFSYLFPEWGSVPTCLLYVFAKKKMQPEYKENIVDWLVRHFTRPESDLIKGDIKKELITFVNNSGNNTLVVMGAHGRATASRLFRKTLSDKIVEETRAAIFIAHETEN